MTQPPFAAAPPGAPRDVFPPGPRSAFVSALRFAIDTGRASRSLARRYGDPVTVPTRYGPLVATGDPDGVREIYTADPEVLEIAPTREILALLLGDHSLILLSGRRHKRERKLLAPPFHGARMRAYGAVFQEVALAHAARWRRDEPFTMQDATQDISLDVIIRAVFGVQDPSKVARFHRVIKGTLGVFSSAALFFPGLRRDFGGLGPWSRFKKLRAELDALIHDEIAQRRRDAAEREDILSLLLAARDEAGDPMSDAELRDELVTLLFAGHETTAITLAWAVYWVHRQPRILHRLRDELSPLGDMPSPDALVKLPYLDAVCNETLRIHPVIPFVLRVAARPFTLRGYALPVGTLVGVSATMAHRHAATYPEPDRFRPERFLERGFSPFEFVPFGGGTRRCVGAAFAVYEMKVILGTLLARHRVELADDRDVKPRRRNITVGPDGGVRVVYRGPA